MKGTTFSRGLPLNVTKVSKPLYQGALSDLTTDWESTSVMESGTALITT